MGLETTAKVTLAGTPIGEAKVQHEGAFLLIRSASQRVKILASDVKGASAAGAILRVDFAEGPVEIDLGDPAIAAKWADKILNPPTRASKLGIKAGTLVYAQGTFDREFEDESPERVASPSDADVLLIAITHPPELADAIALARQMRAKAALWVVYPKGRKDTVTEIQVLHAVREAGFTDTKVCGFNATHTALRFVARKAR
jgi:predicted kinase